MATSSDLIASLDADPAKRGKQFEVFVKWFLKNEPEWATQVDQFGYGKTTQTDVVSIAA